jgi:DNA invertase Pin-like site-specific DNA recombinase
MQGQRVGYIRVSSADQNTARQLDGIALDEWFEEKVSGKDLNRPELARAIQHCRKGDVFIVHSMDRLSRSLVDLLNIVRQLNEKGVTIRFEKEKLEFTGDDSPTSKLMLQVMGSVAEFERSMIRERQREGIAQAKADGKYKGRKPALDAEQIQRLKERVKAGGNKTVIASEFKISRASLYEYIKE